MAASMPGVQAERAIRVTVRGMVQGVGFRFATYRAAERLGISGWVENVPDGSVEVLAQGSESAVENMIAFLGKGPRHARVGSVDIVDVAVDGTLKRFEFGRPR